MKHKLIAFSAAVVLSLSMYPIHVPAADLTDAAVQSYEEQLERYTRQKNEALSEISDISASSESTLAEIAAYDEVIRINEELKKLEMQQLDSIEAQIADANLRIVEAEEKLERQQKAFDSRMKACYMDEDIDFIEMLFSSESLMDFLTRLERVSAVQENDRRIMDDIEKAKVSIEEEKIRLADAELMQKTRVAELERIIADSAALRRSKEDYLTALGENKAAWTAVYESNAAAEAQLNRELEAYLAELAAQSAAEQSGESDGTLHWPIEAGVYYFISSEQGWRTLNGVDEYHLGIDIACAAGTDILAAAGGTVLKSEKHWSYGNYVLIDHGGGLSTLYAHLDDLAVSTGEYVSSGQLVGHCGLTGYTLGYHLHFEVRENGTVTNPRNYITLP